MTKRGTMRTAGRTLLVLAVIVACAWIISLIWWPRLRLAGGRGVELQRGALSVFKYHTPKPAATVQAPRARWPNPQIWWVSPGAAPSVSWVLVPLWLPLIACCAGAWGLRRLDRAMARREGECVRCGYSRQGLAAGAECPECGVKAIPVRPTR